jgi:GNAT superfamily N-acetyltransferase
MAHTKQEADPTPKVGLVLTVIEKPADYPGWLDVNRLARFLHEKMKPYEDQVPDIEHALDYAMSPEEGKGGFIMVVSDNEQLVASTVFLRTGMKGYIPEYILVFVAVDPERRNQGIGAWLVKEALKHCKGSVKLHVEYDNPARRLYERIGFTTKYAEMRYECGVER